MSTIEERAKDFIINNTDPLPEAVAKFAKQETRQALERESPKTYVTGWLDSYDYYRGRKILWKDGQEYYEKKVKPKYE